MGIFSGCLLVSDIDGTLLHDNIIPQCNFDAIEYFKSEGGLFTVASGRGPSVGKQIAKDLKVNAPVLFSNGSIIYDVWEDKVIHADYLSDECKALVKKVVEKFPKIGAEVNLIDKIITVNDNATTRWHRDYDNFDYIPYTCDDAKDLEWVKTLFMTKDQELLDKVKEFMAGIKPQTAEYIVTSPIFYELHVAGVNKALNLPKLLTMLEVNSENLFTIGDYYNDIELVKAGKIGAFTCEAPDDIKPLASFISKSVECGAVADFINYLTNNRKGEVNG